MSFIVTGLPVLYSSDLTMFNFCINISSKLKIRLKRIFSFWLDTDLIIGFLLVVVCGGFLTPVPLPTTLLQIRGFW